MHNCHTYLNESGLGTSEIIAIIAIIISIVTLIFSVYLIYLTKRIEILHQEFDNLCLKNVDGILSGLDKIFISNELDTSKDYREQITVSLVELQVFLLSLKNSIYKKIDLAHIIEIIEEFTETVYNSKEATLLDFKGSYYATKLNIFNALYSYAIQNEFKFFFFFKKRKLMS